MNTVYATIKGGNPQVFLVMAHKENINGHVKYTRSEITWGPTSMTIITRSTTKPNPNLDSFELKCTAHCCEARNTRLS